MTRVIYEYPDDARDGDALVVNEVDVSPTTVTIRMMRYVPKPDPHADADATALGIADKIMRELSWDIPRTDVIFLLRKAYAAVRPSSTETR